jgi:hypothetical protein
MNDDRRLRYPMYGTFAFWLTACPTHGFTPMTPPSQKSGGGNIVTMWKCSLCAICMMVPFSGGAILMSSAPHGTECSICTTYCRNEPGTEKIFMTQNVFVKFTKPPAVSRHSAKIQTHKIIRLFYVDTDFLALIPL